MALRSSGMGEGSTGPAQEGRGWRGGRGRHGDTHIISRSGGMRGSSCQHSPAAVPGAQEQIQGLPAEGTGSVRRAAWELLLMEPWGNAATTVADFASSFPQREHRRARPGTDMELMAAIMKRHG